MQIDYLINDRDFTGISCGLQIMIINGNHYIIFIPTTMFRAKLIRSVIIIPYNDGDHRFEKQCKIWKKFTKTKSDA